MQKNETIAKAELSGYGRFRWVAVVAYDDGSEYDRREFSSGSAALDWLSSFGIPVEPKNQVAERELTAYKNAFDATNPAEITVLGRKVQTPFGTFRLGEIVRYDCFSVGEGILGKIERDGVRAIGKWANYIEESGFDTLVDWAEGGPDLIRKERVSDFLADRIKVEILEAISEDKFPETVGTFEELHDYCDANMLGLPDDYGVAENIMAIHDAQEIADRWLRSGRRTP